MPDLRCEHIDCDRGDVPATVVLRRSGPRGGRRRSLPLCADCAERELTEAMQAAGYLLPARPEVRESVRRAMFEEAPDD